MPRILHFTDIHFGGEDVAAVEGALAYAAKDPPLLSVVTGDLTLNGLPREFRAAAAWLARLPPPWRATPGNHDTPYWNLLLRALTPFHRYRRYIGRISGEQFFDADLSLRMINTSRGAQPRPDWSKGAVNLAVADEAAAALRAGAPGALRVVACHHPLVEAVDAPVTGGVHRGDLAARRLAAGGVDLILTGHVHNPFATPLPYGDRHTYAVGAGTLSQRLRGAPASFNCISFDQDCATVTCMAWTGSHFEPWRTWGLPRRPHHR
jgi:3',5'-cyclic AMP phosphodiesterase CpdA